MNYRCRAALKSVLPHASQQLGCSSGKSVVRVRLLKACRLLIAGDFRFYLDLECGRTVFNAARYPAKAATSANAGSDISKPANEGITGFLPEVTLPEQCARRTTGTSEAYREMIELELSRGRNPMGIWQDLVDGHGFTGGYDHRDEAGRRVPGRLRHRSDGA